MEKISRIVRGNSRVASTDLKSSAAVRPGAPSFGRPVGESTAANASPTTTAARAVAIHNEMLDKKKTGGDQVVQAMADSFFMTRIARPMEEQPVNAPAEPGEIVEVGVEAPEAPRTDELVMRNEEVDVEQPRGYKPRGSYVDVRA